MDFTLEGPEGEKFQLNGPEQAQEARDVAASRTKQATAPGARQEGPVTQWLVSQGEKIKGGIEGIASDLVKHPENLVGTGELGGIVRPAARAVLSPAQIQERLSHYNRELSRGRITEQEYQGFRQGLGLSPASADRIAPLSAAAPPRSQAPSFRRDPSERAMEELFAHNPGVQRPEPQDVTHRVGFLGGDNFARQAFEKVIAPKIDEKSFATKYFDGMYSPSIKLSGNAQGELHFNGPLFKSGQGMVGKIERTIIPGENRVYHNYLELEPIAQGGGVAKSLMRNQFDIYRQLGITRVDLSANIDVGGYSWAKYGFLPTTSGPGGWYSLQRDLMERLRYLQSPGKAAAERLIQISDPSVIWNIADLREPAQNIRYGLRNAEKVPLGKALLLGQDWRGTFDLNNAEQMEKFNAYVKR